MQLFHGCPPTKFHFAHHTLLRECAADISEPIFPNLIKIEFEWHNDTGTSILALIPPRLQRLTVDVRHLHERRGLCREIKPLIDFLCDVQKRAPNLECLKLANFGRFEFELHAVLPWARIPFMETWTSITTLQLEFGVTEGVLESISNLPALKQAGLFVVGPINAGRMFLFPALQVLDTLYSDPEPALALLKSIGNFRIRKIDMAAHPGHPMHAQHTRDVVQALSKQSDLESLSLVGRAPSDDPVTHDTQSILSQVTPLLTLANMRSFRMRMFVHKPEDATLLLHLAKAWPLMEVLDIFDADFRTYAISLEIFTAVICLCPRLTCFDTCLDPSNPVPNCDSLGQPNTNISHLTFGTERNVPETYNHRPLLEFVCAVCPDVKNVSVTSSLAEGWGHAIQLMQEELRQRTAPDCP